jgi:hypothetical protein
MKNVVRQRPTAARRLSQSVIESVRPAGAQFARNAKYAYLIDMHAD